MVHVAHAFISNRHEALLENMARRRECEQV